jgi:pimeloyl-ACP methyl ester carboxylesterase
MSWAVAPALLVGLLWLAVMGTPPQHAAVKKPYPILLIHGLASNPDSWEQLPQYLTNRGFTVYVMDFDEWSWLSYAGKKNKSFDEIAAVIAREIAKIKEETRRDKVNIIAHSIAGIGVRAYMAGWGKRVEPRGQYQGDIARVIYLATPHYGVNINNTKMKLLLGDTDYGQFLPGAPYMYKALEPASEVLVDLHDWFHLNGDNLGVEEITVSSSADHVVKNFCANLDGVEIDPFSPAVHADSRHINLKQFDHAYSDWLGRSRRTILGVGSPSHAVLGIANKFLNGDDGWKKYQTDISKEGTIVMLRFEGSGVDSKGLNVGNVLLKKVMSKKHSKRVKMSRNPDSHVFYSFGLKSGTYELEMPFKGERQTFKFVVDVADGTGTVLEFDPNNPPDEPQPNKPDPGEKPLPPEDVKDLATLKQFVEYRFPKKAVEWLSGSEMAGLVGNVRSTMADMYGNISDNFTLADSHLDVIKLNDTGKYIDFVTGADSEGMLINKLQWTETTIEEPGKGGGGGGGGTIGDPGELELTYSSFLNAFDNWDYSAKNNYYSSTTTICAAFRDHLVSTYSYVERVNDQWDRHHYRTSDYYKHADAIVYIRDRSNPSLDVIVDFCYGSSEGGYLRSKLTCNWHEGPYTWWVDNAFLL